MPNGVDLGPKLFTQWREQQGGILLPLDIGKTVTFQAITQKLCVLAKN